MERRAEASRRPRCLDTKRQQLLVVSKTAPMEAWHKKAIGVVHDERFPHPEETEEPPPRESMIRWAEKSLPRMSRLQFWSCWLLLVGLFVFGHGALWEHPWDMEQVDSAILWSYAPIPFLVLGCLLWSRRLGWKALLLDTLELTFVKYAATLAIALTVWKLAPPPPPRHADNYPEIEPYRTGRERSLKVSDLHKLYFEESRQPAGKPVVFLHGGPGGGTDAKQRRFFDPRATASCCSTSAAAARARRTRARGEHHLGPGRRHRALREHLGIERWQVFGGSWGSDARAGLRRDPPAARHRARAARHLPAAQAGDRLVLPGRREPPVPRRVGAYLAPIPEEERGDLLHAYYRRLTSDDAACGRGRARLERVGGLAPATSEPRRAGRATGEATSSPSLRAHRVPLLRQPRLLRGGHQLLRERRQIRSPHPRR
jgi:pimeloyl-ACP methyl ester carboxylesterase